ncbi:MAG TPA: sulfotransferase [Gaiellaceae bacterium]|nr:sulfotransferase [Gaiellaceae bacterium]
MSAPETGPHRPPPVLVLGVSRSGTTLLREMLDRHSELAIPTESYFIPQLWDRHGERPEREAILADLARLARVREWGVTPENVQARLPSEPSFAEVIAAVYGSYAEARGKRRFGDKTPAYMQHLGLLDRAFPGAQYVHIVRDGRAAAASFAEMRRRPRFSWARPRGLGDFACLWDLEVRGARRFGETAAQGRYLELRYEDLVAEPEPRLREVCSFLGLGFEPAMLEYHRDVDPGTLQDHPRLAEPPTPGVRDWRRQLAPRKLERFEAIAGTLLGELGYPRAYPDPSRAALARARLERAAFRARLSSFRAALTVVRRSPAWRVRQVYVRRTSA